MFLNYKFQKRELFILIVKTLSPDKHIPHVNNFKHWNKTAKANKSIYKKKSCNLNRGTNKSNLRIITIGERRTIKTKEITQFSGVIDTQSNSPERRKALHSGLLSLNFMESSPWSHAMHNKIQISERKKIVTQEKCKIRCVNNIITTQTKKDEHGIEWGSVDSGSGAALPKGTHKRNL